MATKNYFAYETPDSSAPSGYATSSPFSKIRHFLAPLSYREKVIIAALILFGVIFVLGRVTRATTADKGSIFSAPSTNCQAAGNFVGAEKAIGQPEAETQAQIDNANAAYWSGTQESSLACANFDSDISHVRLNPAINIYATQVAAETTNDTSPAPTELTLSERNTSPVRVDKRPELKEPNVYADADNSPNIDGLLLVSISNDNGKTWHKFHTISSADLSTPDSLMSLAIPESFNKDLESLAVKIETTSKTDEASPGVLVDAFTVTYEVGDSQELSLSIDNAGQTVDQTTVMSTTDTISASIKSKDPADGVVQGVASKIVDTVGSQSPPPVSMKATVTSNEGVTVVDAAVTPEFQGTDYANADSWKIDVAMPNSVDPGQYTLDVGVTYEDGTYQVLTQDFLWGVLAMNFDKSPYLVGDTARLDMTVLDDGGRTVCDANIELKISSPTGQAKNLSTDQKQITTGSKCEEYSDSIEPDYVTNFTFDELGDHLVTFKATTKAGSYSITEKVTVVESTPYSISRSGPTRVFPPEKYPMKITVTANQDFEGIVSDVIPNSFTVTQKVSDSFTIRKDGDQQFIEWPAKLMAGESKEFVYEFMAPQISPEFYLFGPLQLKNSQGADEFKEPRQWQIAGDAVGRMLLFWDGGAAPSGWTCVSCTGGDPFFQRFIRGEATYGGTGGAATHTHTATGSIATQGTTAIENVAGATVSSTLHTHTYTPTLSSPSNLPVYRQLNVIRSNTAGTPTSIPAGAIAIFDAAVPTGWTQYAAQDGSYVRGENTAGTTGGSNTHTVSISGTTGAAVGTLAPRNSGTRVSTASAAHTHTVSGTSAASSNEPPYIEAILGKLNSTATPTVAMLAMWDDTSPGGWSEQSSSGKPFYQKFVKPNTTYGTTGGASTHSHANTTGLTTSAPSAAITRRTGAFGSTGAHTHTASVNSYSTVNNEPPYINVIYAKRLPQPAYEQSTYRWYENNDSTDVGTALAAQDTVATAPEQGTAFRLRAAIHIGTNQLDASGQDFKLQYAARSGTCDTSFTGETYADVSTGSGAIRFNDNGTPTDDSALTDNANDPSHSGHTNTNQTYEESNNFTNSQSAVIAGDDALWDFSLVDVSASSNTTYCFRIIKSDNTALNTYTVIPEITTATQTAEQSSFRWFDNNDSTDVATARAAQDAAAIAPAQGIPFRLRLDLHVGGSQLAISGQTYKLQFATRSGACDTSFTGETYADVAAGAGTIRYYNNTTPADDAALTGNVDDPVHSGHSKVNQTYQEANNFTNSQSAIAAGQDGMWDFALVDNSSAADASYCFRVVTSGGATLDSYTVVPEITTAGVVLEQSAFRWYSNIDSGNVGGVLAAQDAAANAPAQGVPFRLRMNLHVSALNLSVSAKNFKLQYAPQSGTCDTAFSGETYVDVDTASGGIRYYDNSTPSDGSSLTGNANDPVHSGHTNVNQTYEESNDFTNSQGAVNIGQDGVWDFSLVDDSADASTAYCFRIVKANGGTLNTYSVVPQITTAAVVIEQSSYRWFENDDSTDVGTPNTTQDTPATAAYQGNAFRLRVNLHVSGRDLTTGTRDFKLQYAVRSGSCDTGFSGETYADVDTASGAIRYYDNTTPTDGSGLTSNASDPTHSGHNIIDQSYEESNDFTSAADILNGEDGLWDFSLVDFSSAPTTAYCFRIVQDNGSPLDSYSNIPEVTTQISVGSMILYYDGVTVPTGWTCISCTPGDAYYQRFPRGESTYGATGGAATHTHTATGAVVATGSAAATENIGGATVSNNSHGHTFTPTIDSQNNLPTYRQLKVIRRNASGPAATLPSGVIGLFNTAVPTGWTRYAAQDSFYPRGEGTVATTGGANTHIHSITGNTSAATGATLAPRLSGTQVGAASNTHTHSVSGATASLSNEPPYIETILGQINSTGSTPDGLIAMWDNTLPSGWNLASGSGGPFYQKFVKGSATYGTTGGGASHSHANVNGITSSAPIGILNRRTGAVGSSSTHTHSVNVTAFSTSSNLPPYIDTIFASKNSLPDVVTSLDQIRVTAATSMATGDWTNETQVQFEAQATDPDNPDTLSLCVEVKPIGTPFADFEDSCGTGVAYSGSAVTASVNISGLTNGQEYHWQVRTKDSHNEYSAWASFGGNAESARDFGIDTSAPTGTVYDGPTNGVDIEFNDGSLDELPANWNINFAGSGQNGDYEYSVGITPGGTEALGWTTTPATSITATGLTLNTSQPYYFNIRATDNAGNQAVISSDGQFVAPILSFSTSPTQVNVGDLNAGNNFTSTAQTTLTTSTNAYNGYVIRGFAEALLESQNNDTIAMFNGGDYSNPDEWLPGDTGYGYHSTDTLVNGVNRYNSGPCPGGGNPPCFAPWSMTFPGDIIADHTSLISGAAVNNEQFTITHRVTTGNNQPSGQYRTTIIYGITARY